MTETETLLPPYSLESEQIVLGAILFESSCFACIAEILKPEDFYRTAHQVIFKALSELFTIGEPMDIVWTSERLKDNGNLDMAGGVPYLMDLAMSVATAENVSYYANSVKGYSTRRRLQTFAYDLVSVAQAEKEIDALTFAQNGILKITQEIEVAKDLTTPELKAKTLEEMQAKLQQPDKTVGLQTGFPALDKLLTGLKPGKLILLGARPSMGKTMMALNIGVNVAIQHGQPVFVYSLEMEPQELMERAFISIAESSSDLNKLQAASVTIPDHLVLFDRPGMTITQLRASIIKSRMSIGQPGLVIIDYIQLMKGVGGNRNEEVGSISRELKQIAREFKFPLIALAQLSRAVESRQDKHPMMSDLRDSGSLEADADTIIFLYRDEYYNKDSDKRGIAEVQVSKNRGGSIGTVELYFRPSVVKFLNTPSLNNPYGQGNSSNANF